MIRVTTGDLYPDQREVLIEPMFFRQMVRCKRILRNIPAFEREFWRSIALMAHAQLSKWVEMCNFDYQLKKYDFPSTEWHAMLRNIQQCKTLIIPLMSAKDAKTVQRILIDATEEFQHLPTYTKHEAAGDFFCKMEHFASDNNMSFLCAIGNDMYIKNSIF